MNEITHTDRSWERLVDFVRQHSPPESSSRINEAMDQYRHNEIAIAVDFILDVIPTYYIRLDKDDYEYLSALVNGMGPFGGDEERIQNTLRFISSESSG